MNKPLETAPTRTSEPAVTAADGRTGRSATCQVCYEDLRFHASGGLGEVFLAHGADLTRDVALKFLKGRSARDPDRRRRFLWEAEVTGRLEHPGVVPVYGLGTDHDGHP